MYTIRRLKEGEAALYREVRLASLQESPEAFSTSYEAACTRSHDTWVAQADASAQGLDRATFVALANHPMGLAALYRDPVDSLVGDLIQMWIAPAYRGGPLATDLLDHIFAWAAGHGFQTIRAEVTEGNQRALRFYQKYGFGPATATAESSELVLTKAVGGGVPILPP